VVRKCGSPPAGPRDGERIAASLDQAVDSGLREDQVYHYAIHAIYRMADSRRYPSQGIVVAAVPRLPLPPMNAPRLMITPSGHVRLDWIEPPRGSVRILRTTRPPPASPGAQLSVAAAEQFAGDWLALSGPDRAEDADPPATGFCYYTPLVMVGSMLTIGHPAALSRMADPSELRAARTGGPGESATTAVPGPHPQITVSYSLKRPWLPARPWVLTLRTEPSGAAVPQMVLVANERAVPLSAEDGEIVARLPAGQDGATHVIRTSLNLSRIGVRAFLDPTIDPGSLPPIRLRHPETGLARV